LNPPPFGGILDRLEEDAMDKPNPEWYSGSDASGVVAAGIEAVIERMDDHVADHSDVSHLRELLEVEREVNWRAFLQGLIGTIHYDLDELDDGAEALGLAVSGFRPFLDTFDEVLSVYCQCCYTLGALLMDRQQYGPAAACFLRCLPYVHEVYEETYTGHVLSHLTDCLAHTGDAASAVVFAEAATFASGGECDALERLMTAYVAAEQPERATEVFHRLSESCRDAPSYGRILDFARRHLGEPGGVVN
jgi:hypothetical protein